MIDPDVHAHYLKLADEARASDPRMREVDELLAQASELRAMRADAVDELTRTRLARLVARLDGKDDPKVLSKAHPTYLTSTSGAAPACPERPLGRKCPPGCGTMASCTRQPHRNPLASG